MSARQGFNNFLMLIASQSRAQILARDAASMCNAGARHVRCMAQVASEVSVHTDMNSLLFLPSFTILKSHLTRHSRCMLLQCNHSSCIDRQAFPLSQEQAMHRVQRRKSRHAKATVASPSSLLSGNSTAKQIMTMQQAMQESQRCLQCADAPCAAACPAGTQPDKFLRQVRELSLNIIYIERSMAHHHQHRHDHHQLPSRITRINHNHYRHYQSITIISVVIVSIRRCPSSDHHLQCALG